MSVTCGFGPAPTLFPHTFNTKAGSQISFKSPIPQIACSQYYAWDDEQKILATLMKLHEAVEIIVSRPYRDRGDFAKQNGQG